MNLNQYNLLTEDEKELFDALKNLQGGGMWGEGIRSWFQTIDNEEEVWKCAVDNQVQQGTAEGFRHLIQSLQEQASDNPALMLRILGAEAYELLMRLEEASLT